MFRAFGKLIIRSSFFPVQSASGISLKDEEPVASDEEHALPS